MATAHVVFHMPAGVLGVLVYQALSNPQRFGPYILPFFTFFTLSLSVSIFGSLADFFIYLYAFAAFRESALRLALWCFSCCFSRPRHASTSGHSRSLETTGRRFTADQKCLESNKDSHHTHQQQFTWNSDITWFATYLYKWTGFKCTVVLFVWIIQGLHYHLKKWSTDQVT